MNVHCNRSIGCIDETWVKAEITKANGREHWVFNFKLDSFAMLQSTGTASILPFLELKTGPRLSPGFQSLPMAIVIQKSGVG